MDTTLCNNDIDNPVDDMIYSCLDLDKPKSFFLFAGAGSGKTRSLVSLLSRIRKHNRQRLRLYGQQIAVITYTNAACDEIKHRLEHDSLFLISTIHSFAWEMIKSFQQDIRKWLDVNVRQEITDIQEKQAKGRAGTKAAIDRVNELEAKNKRLDGLPKIKRFVYNPNGENRSRDSLNHSEVIKIAAYLLSEKLLMQRILIRKYPILLIDESQDTNKLLMDAFLKVQKDHSMQFSLGLFGDTMQRIYTDGVVDLVGSIPEDWERPAKVMNHRCPKRVIGLINKIRSATDKVKQVPRSDKDEGIVRLFVIPSVVDDKTAKEREISSKMAEITGDKCWCGSDSEIKVLTLEHHMAARRMGFIDLFSSLDRVGQFKTGLRDGSLPGLRFFTQLVLPLIKAKRNGDNFTVCHVIRNNSPLLSKEALKKSEKPLEQINIVNKSVFELYSLWQDDNGPRLLDVLQYIAKTKLFHIPESLAPIANRTIEEQNEIDKVTEQSTDSGQDLIDAWDKALSNHFFQIEAYNEYVSDKARFGTHQGVKGLEFPRVMVILDDGEAGGFSFSYEKLFGAKELTKTDKENEAEGKDTSPDRTRRLFYVTCSRAKESLAIVAYTQEPLKVKHYVLSQGWFDEHEIVELQ